MTRIPSSFRSLLFVIVSLFSLVTPARATETAVRPALPPGYLKVRAGMSEAEVEALLGKPLERQGDTWTFEQGTFWFSKARLTSALIELEEAQAPTQLLSPKTLGVQVQPKLTSDVIPSHLTFGIPEAGLKIEISPSGRTGRIFILSQWKPTPTETAHALTLVAAEKKAQAQSRPQGKLKKTPKAGGSS